VLKILDRLEQANIDITFQHGGAGLPLADKDRPARIDAVKRVDNRGCAADFSYQYINPHVEVLFFF
jgi:hypothetical protein